MPTSVVSLAFARASLDRQHMAPRHRRDRPVAPTRDDAFHRHLLIGEEASRPEFAAAMLEAHGFARDHAGKNLAAPVGEAFVAEGSEGEVHRESRFMVAGRERTAIRGRGPGFVEVDPMVIRICVHPPGSSRAMTEKGLRLHSSDCPVDIAPLRMAPPRANLPKSWATSVQKTIFLPSYPSLLGAGFASIRLSSWRRCPASPTCHFAVPPNRLAPAWSSRK